MKLALDPRENTNAFRDLILLLTRYRALTLEMARREINDRFAGQYFGLFWTFGHPLILMLVYIFIFGVVFKTKIGGTQEMPLNYATYLLSGLIPWLAIVESMSKASMVIIGHANLVKQVIFPIEVLPVKGTLSSLFTQLVFLSGLVLYVLISQGIPPWTYLLLPILILLQFFFMIGLNYILSAIGTYFRDMKDFVQVFSVIGVYLMPTFFLPSAVPKIFQPIFYLNPFSYIMWCFQDALYFGRLEHWWAWLVLSFMSLISFIFGYRLFRRLKNMFGNVL